MAIVLSKQDIHQLLRQQPPLLEGYINLEEQVQPNGIDLTLREVALLQSSGKIAVTASQRQVSNLAPLVFDGLDFIDLMPGTYIITYNEIVHLPRNIMALATPRSSLLRCGVTVNTAVWDAGYSGRSQSPSRVSLAEECQNCATCFLPAKPGDGRLSRNLPEGEYNIILAFSHGWLATANNL